MTRLRRPMVIAALAAAAVAACQGSKPTLSVTCKSFASAEALCADNGCASAWSDVETNRAYCDTCTGGTWSAGDCGDYHVLDSLSLDSGSRYYYRRDTGTLVYAQHFGAPNPYGSCSVVGTTPFSAPPGCDSIPVSRLPGWCPTDAGAPGERLFSCCRTPIASCNFNGVCPATWSEAQALAPSLCAGSPNRTNPEVGSCGSDQVFRYWYGTTLPFTLFYDASGALIAGIDETTGRCEFGPAAGLTLPICDTTLASACPDGGAAP